MTVIQIRRGEMEAPDDSGPGVVRHVAGADGSPSRPASHPTEEWLEAARRAYLRRWWAEHGDSFEFCNEAYGDVP